MAIRHKGNKARTGPDPGLDVIPINCWSLVQAGDAGAQWVLFPIYNAIKSP